MSERDDNPTAEGNAAVPAAAVPSDGSPAGTHDALADRNGGAPVSIALFAERRTQMGLTHEDVVSASARGESITADSSARFNVRVG